MVKKNSGLMSTGMRVKPAVHCGRTAGVLRKKKTLPFPFFFTYITENQLSLQRISQKNRPVSVNPA